jgi:CheY-like chemotaxis protein
MTLKSVLVIEDHTDTRHMVEDYLRFSGIPTLCAENGLAGLTALHEGRPALVLLDLSMPIMDGWRFREEQRRLPDVGLSSVPVVVMSALSECEHHARTLGAVDVITKPIDLDRMVEIVRRYCVVEC